MEHFTATDDTQKLDILKMAPPSPSAGAAADRVVSSTASSAASSAAAAAALYDASSTGMVGANAAGVAANGGIVYGAAAAGAGAGPETLGMATGHVALPGPMAPGMQLTAGMVPALSQVMLDPMNAGGIYDPNVVAANGPEMYTGVPYYNEMDNILIDAINEDFNQLEYPREEYGQLDYIWDNNRRAAANSVVATSVSSDPHAQHPMLSAAAHAARGAHPSGTHSAAELPELYSPELYQLRQNARRRNLPEASPRVSKKRRIEQTYDPSYWSSVNQNISVNTEEEAPATFQVRWHPSPQELKETSRSLMYYLLSDYDKVEASLNGDAPDAAAAAAAAASEDGAAGVPMKASHSAETVNSFVSANDGLNDEAEEQAVPSSAADTALTAAATAAADALDGQKRRKLGDEIRWEPKSVGVMLELNERFNVRQKDVSKILGSIRNSCFGILNMRELGAWQRSNGRED